MAYILYIDRSIHSTQQTYDAYGHAAFNENGGAGGAGNPFGGGFAGGPFGGAQGFEFRWGGPGGGGAQQVRLC